jgi:hypothetical protein
MLESTDELQACRECGKMMVRIPAFTPFESQPIWFCHSGCNAIFDEDDIDDDGPRAKPIFYLIIMSPKEKSEHDGDPLGLT